MAVYPTTFALVTLWAREKLATAQIATLRCCVQRYESAHCVNMQNSPGITAVSGS